jgi:predicted CXXCH cytochrome family protein
MYPDGGLTGTVDTEPSAISLLCLSCHDGTVAIDTLGGNTMGDLRGSAVVDSDLSLSHPISVTFDTTTPPADMQNPTSAQVIDGKVECASCHDTHASTTEDNLLYLSNDASEICLDCHDK